MAEQEVIKHTKRIFGIWKTQNNFFHKLSEFIGEILIIVFAITLSIYVHDRSQLRHQRHEAKEFLLGLRQDLKADIVEMNSDKSSYEKSGIIFRYIVSRKFKEPLNPDTVQKYSNWIFNTTGLVANSGRFEGFKSSGKIETIENNELQNYIMDLYQEDIPTLIVSTNDYTAKKQRLFQYLEANMKRTTDSTTNFVNVLASDPAVNICRSLTFVRQILNRYDTCINKTKAIIDHINRDYGK